MASSNPGPSMTDETNDEENVRMPSFDTLRIENLASVREPFDTIDDKKFEKFSFHSSNVIGRGCYSAVFKGTFRGKKEVAIKRMQKIDAEIADKEYDNLTELSHQNVIKNMHIEEDNDFIYIVLELCHKSLEEVVTKNMINDYAMKVKLLHDIASGLNHLHDEGIIHRDLKPSNILIKINSDGIIPKIADFGFSRKIPRGRDHYSASDGGLGTPCWCPKEVLDNKEVKGAHITTAVDMFAYGCIVHFVMCPATKLKFRHPFGTLKDDSGVDNIIKSIKAGNRRSYISTIVYQKPEAINKVKRLYSDILIQDLINFDPKNRPSTQHVLNFPLFWDVPKQLHFITDQQKYLYENKDQHFEDNCRKFFTHKRLSKMCVEPVDWGTVAKQLTEIGLPGVPQTIPEDDQKTNIFSHMLRVVRNKIVHYVENYNYQRLDMDLMLTNFHKEFPFFFPVLWLTYRYLQTPSRYSDKIDKVKIMIQEYYTPLKIANPNCLVTNLEFISKT